MISVTVFTEFAEFTNRRHLNLSERTLCISSTNLIHTSRSVLADLLRIHSPCTVILSQKFFAFPHEAPLAPLASSRSSHHRIQYPPLAIPKLQPAAPTYSPQHPDLDASLSSSILRLLVSPPANQAVPAIHTLVQPPWPTFKTMARPPLMGPT